MAPFREWLDRKLLYQGLSVQEFANLYGVEEKTLSRSLNKATTVSEPFVDLVLSREGGTHIIELYPELYPE